MRYRLCEIDLTQPLPELRLTAQDNGIAVILRQAGRPVGFFMESAPPASRIDSQSLDRWITRELGPHCRGLPRSFSGLAPGRPQPASVTVAICTRDRPDLLAKCLAHLLPQRLTEEGEARFEVLVIDNAPADEQTRVSVAGREGVRYVVEAKPGLDFARNRAMAEAQGELLAFLDDDVIVDPHWFDGLREAYADHPEAGCFTGLVLPWELETEAQVLFERRGGFRKGFKKRYFGQKLEGDDFFPCNPGILGAGCNMAFRLEVLRNLGGFDAALDTGPHLPGGGDLDIFYRVIRQGYGIAYEPGYLVFHRHRRERRRLRRQYWSWGLGFMAFLDKCQRYDPEFRPRLRRQRRAWFRTRARQAFHSLAGRYVLPPDLIFAELWGGVRGMLGEYGRSSRRTGRLQ
ncbi:MAG: glycosyltransferase [Thermodesulfobacteriota bacterium]